MDGVLVHEDRALPLTTALHEVGYTQTDTESDFVVLGETRTYSFEAITKAIRLIGDGARFIATNPDSTGPSADGPLPATGSVAALITKATGRVPYFVGKPNPMMFTGSTSAEDIERFPFRPARVLPSIAEAVDLI